MIIDKVNKGLQTRNDKPNENWTDDVNVFVVEDGSELALKIIQNYPHYDFVLNDNEELIDITPTERPPEPPQPPTTEERIEALEMAMLSLL